MRAETGAERDLAGEAGLGTHLEALLAGAGPVLAADTPLIVFSADRLRGNVRRLRAAAGDVAVHFAVKALYSRTLLARMGGAVDAFDVQSHWEASWAPHDRPLTFHSPWLDERVLPDRRLAAVTVNSPAQAARLAARRPAVRWGLRLALSRQTPDQFVTRGAQFGVAGAEASRLAAQGAAAGRPCRFLHHHSASRLRDPARARRLSEAFVHQVLSLDAEVVEALDGVNLGGGLDGALELSRAGVALEAVIGALLAPVRERLGGLRITLEPGRHLVEDAAAVLTTVQEVRSMADGIQAVVDVGSGFLVPLPAARFRFCAVEAEAGPTRRVQLVDGTCSPSGVLATQWTRRVPRRGERVALLNVGGYTTSCAGPFHSPPPALWVADDGAVECVADARALEAGCRALVR